MISREHRFHGRASIQRVYKNGKSVRAGALLGLRYAPNPRRRTYRVAVVVSRKVSKSAVKRNRIRRRIYEGVRNLSSGLAQPYDLVFIAYDPALTEVSVDKLTTELKGLFKKAHLTASTTPLHDIVEPKK